MYCISYLAYSKSHNLLFKIPLVYKYCYLYKVRTLKTIIVPNKKAPEGAISENGAEYGSLLELFNKTLQPVLSSPQIILLYSEIENYINGVEN